MAAQAIERLKSIMAALRTPETGCPWDLQQDFKSIVPYTLEEAYEVADAVERGDMGDLRDELGDLLLQVVFHARMAEEQGAFDFDDVATAISDKMERRHPHVFDDTEAATTSDVRRNWEEIKDAERAAKGLMADSSLMADVPLALPGLNRAVKLQKRAARCGFDWSEATPIFDKLAEEIGELQTEMVAETPSPDRLEDELGDILFVVANLARHLKVNPEAALRRTNAKFERRFRWMENHQNERAESLSALNLDELEMLWQQAKKHTG
ncbi:MAG: nucleoside triphosphate pyrophosphohydrolase [Parvibaculales bacterium]